MVKERKKIKLWPIMEKRTLINRGLRTRVRKIEERVFPKPNDDYILVWSFGSPDEPHGKYGYRKFHIHTEEKEACTEEEEIEFLRKAYLRIPDSARKQVNHWSSFEKFKKQNRCTCKIHRNSGSHIDWVELNSQILSAALKNFKDSLRMNIWKLIRSGEIEKTKEVERILSLFSDEK